MGTLKMGKAVIVYFFYVIPSLVLKRGRLFEVSRARREPHSTAPAAGLSLLSGGVFRLTACRLYTFPSWGSVACSHWVVRTTAGCHFSRDTFRSAIWPALLNSAVAPKLPEPLLTHVPARIRAHPLIWSALSSPFPPGQTFDPSAHYLIPKACADHSDLCYFPSSELLWLFPPTWCGWHLTPW